MNAHTSMYRVCVPGACLAAVLTASLLLAAEPQEANSCGSRFDPIGQFDHVGFITTEKKPGERFVAATKVWVTDIGAHPYRVEWLRFEPDSPVTGPVRENPHVAFRVDNIAKAAKGLKVLLEPFDAGIAKVGFYQTEDGAVVELMEYYEKTE